jgi:hypothetical protein
MRCSTTYFDSDAVVADVVHDRLKTGAQVRLGLLVHPRVRREHLGCDAVRAEDLVRVRCREMRSGGGGRCGRGRGMRCTNGIGQRKEIADVQVCLISFSMNIFRRPAKE